MATGVLDDQAIIVADCAISSIGGYLEALYVVHKSPAGLICVDEAIELL